MSLSKPKILEVPVDKNSDLYRLFDGLPFYQKEAYIQAFQENKKQDDKKNQMKAEIERITEKNEQTFFNAVLEEVILFQQLKKQNFETFTVEYNDQIKGNEIQEDVEEKQNHDFQNFQQKGKFDTNPAEIQSNQITLQQKAPIGSSRIQENKNKKLFYKETLRYDEILNSKEIVVMRLSLFKLEMMNGNSQVQEMKNTFQFCQSFKSEMQDCYQIFNQNFSQNERDILTGSGFVNSNIINAYANYLMIEDEKYYFQLPKKQRQTHKRLYIFRSDFLTDCSDKPQSKISFELQQQKLIYVWSKYLEDFKAIQYQFWVIYKKIGFIVNFSNIHWCFIQVHVDEKQMVIYDSKKKDVKYYQRSLVDILNFLFGETFRDPDFKFDVFLSDQFLQQNDGSSCGYYTCIAMDFLSQQQKGKMKSLEEIRLNLKELLLPEKKFVQNKPY